MKTVVLYNIISFIILVALIFVLRIVSKSNLRQNQQLVIKVIATILIVRVIAFVLFIDAIAFGIIGPVQDYQFQFDKEVLCMKKRISRILGLIMLIIAIAFIVFALNHPEMSFPWNNTITWLLYGLYILVTVMLLIAPKTKK